MAHGGRAAGAKGLRPGEKTSPMGPENGRERGQPGQTNKAQDFALYPGGNGKPLKGGGFKRAVVRPEKTSEEDASGCCVVKELVGGRLESERCLDGADKERVVA